MNPQRQQELETAALRSVTRRHFFGQCGVGVGKMALAGLLAGGMRSQLFANGEPVSEDPLAPREPHFAPKAKRVIHLFMAGAPSQLDMFDYKPALAELEGKPIPPSVVGDQRYAFIRPDAAAIGPRFAFNRYGESGAELSDIIPHLAEVADEIAIVKSCHTDQFNHAPAQLFFNTGFSQPGRPCLGAWALYGLGSETQDLPAFIVLSTGGGTSAGMANWSSGFLPTIYAGTPFRSQGDPVADLSSPAGVDAQLQRDSIDLITQLNGERLATEGDPEIATRIASYEMAFRMQTSTPELTDLASETQETLDMYGATPGQPSFAANCLLARRMIERGVRFVNIYHKGWDAHSDVEGNLRGMCGATDQPTAALIRDLKQRGLLEDTLVIWNGEFGRTPMVESNPMIGRSMGRDHHPQAFTSWMAGGGIKPGITYGATDELGFHVVENPVHVHDLQATILHLLGFDHERLTFHHQGRDFRLTDVHGHVVRELLA